MKQFIRYAVFGSVIYWIQIILTTLITEITGLWHLYSFLISLFLGWSASFFVHKHLTFKAKDINNTKFFIFILVLFAMYTIWFGLNYVLHLFITKYYVIVIIVSSIPSSLLGYYLNRYIVFKK
ncbi:hypothetical protein HN695_04435 [Candidatus Woesearchaeota archaeon]|jgi:putative flippase GtrA|nr:hypothetical protein [Candidatus Woesearchaeota archaeon]MBT5272398.1 hypothetical protein [Candidatus Woesearchaeota archaeon]MBT6041267.1 hypothetical protein [Candidatus Woesearchaeota archaeon]MBT6336670.1 hypothetical protein [Candidatus Woesearchaeota archaeon]MBT7927560.1 hypothetical protein [Candidatus Woesearchaeota archaeon]